MTARPVQALGALLIVLAIVCWVLGVLAAVASDTSVASQIDCGSAVTPDLSQTTNQMQAADCAEQLETARLEAAVLLGTAALTAPIGTFLCTRRRCAQCFGLIAQQASLCPHCGEQVTEPSEATE